MSLPVIIFSLSWSPMFSHAAMKSPGPICEGNIISCSPWQSNSSQKHGNKTQAPPLWLKVTHFTQPRERSWRFPHIWLCCILYSKLCLNCFFSPPWTSIWLLFLSDTYWHIYWHCWSLWVKLWMNSQGLALLSVDCACRLKRSMNLNQTQLWNCGLNSLQNRKCFLLSSPTNLRSTAFTKAFSELRPVVESY